MRYTSHAKLPDRRDGFTLVEILLVAPVVIITITIFIALIVNMTGDVLRTRASTEIIHATQAALSQIESDTLLATEFMATSYATNSPQAMVTGNYDTAGSISTTNSPAKLIIRSLTTTLNPSLNTRQLAYQSMNGCGTISTTPYLADIVYYLRTNADSTQTLWRRTVFGQAATAGTGCPTPWQLPSCSPGYTNLTYCKADDAKLLDNVTSMTVSYYDATGTSSATTSSGMVAVKLTLVTTNTVAGRSSSYSSSTFASKQPAPPVVGAPGSLTLTVATNPGSNPVVSWNAVTGNQPITYTVRYGTGGNPSNIMTGCDTITTTQCTLTGLTSMVSYAISVTATNAVGSSVATGTAMRTPP
ncbi:MAG: hypothetical protein JWM00_631 [Candidatus Saccharibacteria bacterium]|nr:hypothetical protein [Candidatus Saccharibacteria bacterium]